MENEQSEYKKTLEELKLADKKSNELLNDIKSIVEILKNEQITLQDIIASEEQLKDTCEQLQDTCKNIITLRQWLDFISSEPRF